MSTPQYLTGDKKAINEFLNKYDVCYHVQPFSTPRSSKPPDSVTRKANNS
jgi:hypothetical protein